MSADRCRRRTRRRDGAVTLKGPCFLESVRSSTAARCRRDRRNNVCTLGAKCSRIPPSTRTRLGPGVVSSDADFGVGGRTHEELCDGIPYSFWASAPGWAHEALDEVVPSRMQLCWSGGRTRHAQTRACRGHGWRTVAPRLNVRAPDTLRPPGHPSCGSHAARHSLRGLRAASGAFPCARYQLLIILRSAPRCRSSHSAMNGPSRGFRPCAFVWLGSSLHVPHLPCTLQTGQRGGRRSA